MCQVFYGCFYGRLVIWCEVDCAAGARFKMPVNLMNCIIDLCGNDYRGNSTAFYASCSSLSVCSIIWWKHFTLIGLSSILMWPRGSSHRARQALRFCFGLFENEVSSCPYCEMCRQSGWIVHTRIKTLVLCTFVYKCGRTVQRVGKTNYFIVLWLYTLNNVLMSCINMYKYKNNWSS